MNDRLRRHIRLIAGSVAVLLLAGLGYALRHAGSARAQPAGAATQARVIAQVLAPVAQRSGGRLSSARAARSRAGGIAARVSTVAARVRTTPSGVRTPPPSRRGAALALRQVTGLSPAQVTSRPVCPRPTAGHATCAAEALVLRASGAPVHPHVSRYRSLGQVRPGAASGAHPASVAAATPPQADTPAYLQQAYDLTYLSHQVPQRAGVTDTVAVVDAFDDPTAASDLATYRSFYGLPACGNGCFRKVGQTGTTSVPGPDVSWEQEISLDLDAVSAICPQCHILLVEANSNSFSDLQAAMQIAVSKGANQISASWWGVSSRVPTGFGTFPGVATVAATGDAGYPGPGEDNYPAALPGVTAAGGTSLAPAAAPSARGFGEAAWSWNGSNGGGSGCDLQFPRPAYQPAAGCAGRAYADLSADADPNTGLTVYNHGSWSLVGGTSLSTPLIAAYYAITGVTGDTTPQWAYSASGALNDVLTGSSGNCAPLIAYICNAGTGYDGPTGVGSISGGAVPGGPGIGGPAIGSGSSTTYTESVAPHGATIAGGIYRNGLDTNWWIEYGTDTSYGAQSPATDIGTGSGPVAVTGYLSGLAPGTPYHYRLVAQNSKGTVYGYDYTFTTQPAPAGGPTAAFAVTSSTPAPGIPTNFDASASTAGTIGSISDYSWNFGDGMGVQDAGPSATTSHTYAKRGTYTVTLTVSNGQTDTITQAVTVDDSTASFTPSSSTVPTGTTIAFNAGASTGGAGGAITDYSWSFGDGLGTVDSGTNGIQSHPFSTPGTYTVTLTTTDDLDVTSRSTAQVTVAAFTATPAPAAPGDEVTLTPANPSPGSTYAWDFGDHTTDTTTSATEHHTFTARGSYTVSLSVDNGAPITATVVIDTPPTPQFAPSPAAVLPGTQVGFDASASSAAAGGSIADYSWNFGDGTPTQDTGSTAAAGHAFPTSGLYTVTLTTTDDFGVLASTSHQVTVDQPSAAFTVSGTSPAANTPVTFDASDTSDPGSAITDYSWDFGDGATVDAGTATSVTHSFGAAGTYTVRLTVTDQLSLPDTTSEQVVIVPPVTTSGTTTTTPTTPVTSTTPTSGPPNGGPAPRPFAVRLTGAGRQRLKTTLAQGLRLGLSLNQSARVSFQITIPLAQTRHTAKQAAQKPTVVLLRGVRRLAAGSRTITLKLSPVAARRLAPRGPLVLTVRVTMTNAAGKSVTRSVKITLTR